MIEIDGSLGEGGGQILRSSLSLSLLTGKPFRLHNIRAGRPRPGLQPQHLASVRAAAEISNSRVTGASIGSAVITFEPGKPIPGKYHFSIGTAGATGLVLHTVWLPLIYLAAAPSELMITGGTHVSHAPSAHFLDQVWRKWLEKLGIRVDIELQQPGFYPRGGGRIRVLLEPVSRISGLIVKPAEDSPRTAEITSAVARLPETIAVRQARRAEAEFRRHKIRSECLIESWDGGPGTVLMSRFTDSQVPHLFCALGEKGRPAEAVADESAQAAMAWREAGQVMDEFSADQILLPLVFSPDASVLHVREVTGHLLTNMHVVSCFVERSVICEGEEGTTGILVISPEPIS
jgi:RNA 3'-phosphate cyclase